MTENKETLRGAGAVAICKVLSPCSGFCHSPRCAVAIESYGAAMDAAIATMFERLRTPSDDMIQAGDTAPKPSEFVWQAMLTAFKQENSDGR